MKAEVKTIHFDGLCPFLLCLESGPHAHPICPECGAVRDGNINCPTCERDGKPYREAEVAKMKLAIEARGRRN